LSLLQVASFIITTIIIDVKTDLKGTVQQKNNGVQKWFQPKNPLPFALNR
jgi:hypothetical protein